MCEIEYTRDLDAGLFAFDAEGHADVDGGPVCAAVSAYLYLIAQGLEIWQDGVILGKFIDMKPGDSTVSAQYRQDMGETASLQWDTVALGFLMLQDNYPDKVKITIK